MPGEDPHASYFQLEAMVGAERLEEYEVLEEEYLIQQQQQQQQQYHNNNKGAKTSRNQRRKNRGHNSNNNNNNNMMMMEEEEDGNDNNDDMVYDNDTDNDNDEEEGDEEMASSGDEDEELVDLQFMWSEEPIHLDHAPVEEPHTNHNHNDTSMMEPWARTDGSHPHHQNNNNNNNSGNNNNNSSSSSKLPFHRRKIRYFDQVTAYECTIARTYLKAEYQSCKKRVQQEICQQVIRQVTTTTTTATTAVHRIHPPSTTTATDGHLSSSSRSHHPALSSSSTTNAAATTQTISFFDHPMTPAMAAALLMESLCLNPLESIEGMAKCYDGIVAAGVALLDTPSSSLIDPNTLPVAGDPPHQPPHHPYHHPHRMNTRRSEIMAALAPLLITSLEPPSGDVLLLLAKLRRLCGTVRYRRRLVQRIAPALVRPPDGSAMWCLRHQNDMMAIFAATELILDAAFDVFSKGWYERGRWMLADSKRAETLSVAAKQLQNLSQDPADSLVFSTQRNGNNLRHHHHRRLKNEANNLDEPLAEWEVIAVDRQIRISIFSVFHTDWTRAAIHETVPRPVSRQRALSAGGTSSSGYNNNNNNNPRQRQSSQPAGGSGAGTTPTAEMSPRTPRGASGFKAPASPLSESSIMSSPEPPGLPLTNNNNNNSNYQNMERSQTPPPPSSLFTNSNAIGSENNELSPRQQQYQSALTPQLPRSPKSQDRNLELSPRHLLSKDVVTGSGSSNNNNNDHKINMGSSTGSNTPLSPSASSVGSASENMNAFHQQQHKPNTVGSMTLTSTTGPSTAHYRMLTSTVAERKRTVAACRALRAQIQRFEDAFVQLHGRPPKGAGDRAPLATTYAQYREWKRAIRADAACRIQALLRGTRCRWSLLRNNSNNATITRIIRNRAGRASFESTTVLSTDRNTPTFVSEKVAVPFEIEESDPMTSPESIKSGNVVASLSPQWANQMIPPRLSSVGSPNDAFSNNIMSSPSNSINVAVTSPSNPRQQQLHNSGNSSPSSSPTDQSPDSTLINMSFSELQARKRDLKQQLKQYDMNFARKHGRMPVKSEKEPIRHLYESYNTLKGQITEMERDGKHLPSSSNALSSGSNQQHQQLAVSPLQQRPLSPVTSGSDTDDSTPVALSKFGMVVSPVGSAGAARSKRKLPKPGTTVPPTGTGGSSGAVNSSASSMSGTGAGSSGGGNPAVGQHDLIALKAEKQNLHTMLRSFEKDFFRENRRQVSSFADIRPVASQYRRYKEIKKQIASLQQHNNSSTSSSDR